MNKIITIVSAMGAATVFLMVMLTGADVAGRYLFNKPVRGTLDIIQLMMAVLVTAGIVLTTAKDDHIAVDSLYDKVDSRGKFILKVFGYIVAVIMLAILTWQGVQGAVDAYEMQKISDMLEVPIFPFKIFYAIGFFICTIISAVFLINLVRNRKVQSSGDQAGTIV